MLTERFDGKFESGLIKAEKENDPGARVVVSLLTTRDVAEDVVHCEGAFRVIWMFSVERR